jgi:signal transduction histidine kinase
VIATVATSGILLLVYLIVWAGLSEGDDGRPGVRPFSQVRVRRDWDIAAGVGLLTLSVLLTFRQLGVWWSDALIWPLVLSAFGTALLWGRSRAATVESTGVRTWATTDISRAGREAARDGPRESDTTPLPDPYRGLFGMLFVIGAGLLVLSSNHIFGGVRDAALTAVVVTVAVAMILAPFFWRFGRNLAAERTERVRSQERAELAAHLHDSVLQTLALMQKRANEPREVAALARRQERELRDWLAGDNERPTRKSFATALRATAETIEDDHRLAIDVIVVGDRQIDERAEAVLGAVREGLLNAAKHAADAAPIHVYAEVEGERVEVFLRDWGPGFEVDGVAADRRGLRESIVGRMERAGGHAEIRSSPGHGTEISLVIGPVHSTPGGEPG